jgi:hypothetical protein
MSAKFIEPSHRLSDPDAAARKLIEIANAVETVQDGCIYIERVNRPSSKKEARRTNSAPRSRDQAGLVVAGDNLKSGDVSMLIGLLGKIGFSPKNAAR